MLALSSLSTAADSARNSLSSQTSLWPRVCVRACLCPCVHVGMCMCMCVFRIHADPASLCTCPDAIPAFFCFTPSLLLSVPARTLPPPPILHHEGPHHTMGIPPAGHARAGWHGGHRACGFSWIACRGHSVRRCAIPTDSLPLSDRQASFGDAKDCPRRGRGCIHRTSSTRRSSAAQVTRTHSPTRASQVQTISWSKLRRRSTRPTVQDNHSCANGNNCPRGGTFKFSPEDQAFNEASFATGGTQEPKRCACTSACVPVSGRCLLDMKYPSTLSPKPEP